MSQTHFSGVLPPNVPTAVKLFIGLLSRLKSGHLQIITPEGNQMMFGDLHQPPSATLKINDWRACARIISAGDIGFAECLEADWVSTPDLTALLRLALKNEAALQRMVNGGRISTLWYRLKHWLRPNTREGSRRNIHAHYDIGNDFYQRWLDPSFTYSSAVFHGDYSISLEQAQANKYQRIIDELKLKAGDHVLEIGCGWGGFAEHAGKQGIRITGITISPAQLAIAKERVQKNNLTELVDLQLCDYRDLTGQFDAVVSIEMFEAVGERFWAEYFKTVSARLKSGGNALIQSITILERDFERYRSSTDFIQQYIFPGGMLPSIEIFQKLANDHGLEVIDTFTFGLDYARTLLEWRKTFMEKIAEVKAQGFDDEFIRTWEFYLAYCEAGFRAGNIDVAQFTLVKK